MKVDQYSIRLLAQSDLVAYHALVERNRERLLSFFAGTATRTKTFEDTSIFLSEMLAKAMDRTYFPYVIVDDQTGQLIGFLDIKNIDWNIPKAELGSFIDESSAGKGIIGRALSLFTAHCFSHYGFVKLFLRTHEHNVAAIKVAEKCGFELEGKIRCDYKTSSGELVDLLYFGKLAVSGHAMTTVQKLK